jgi:hypothetical protein
MADFQVGDSINDTAVAEFSTLLRTAYDNGRTNGGSMDWNDVQAALDRAVEAFGDDGAAFIAAANAGFDDEPRLGFTANLSPEERAAAQLLFAYRYPEDVAMEDVDASWDILLQADVERGVKPYR